jgi:hypothetical protein
MRMAHKVVRFISLPFDYILQIIKSQATLLKNIFSIAISLCQNVQGLAKEKHTAKICPVNHSSVAVRDLMIILNQMINRASIARFEIDHLFIYLDKNAQFNQMADVFSCFQLSPPIKNIEFMWVAELSNKYPVPGKSHGKSDHEVDMSSDWQAFIDNESINICPVDHLFCNDRLFLEVPVSTRVWARNIIKSRSPLTNFIAMNFEITKVYSFSFYRHFFLDTWRDFPEIHFILFNDSIALQEGFLKGLPNVTVTKVLGYNFLEEFALCQLSDVFVGPYDEYAMARIGSDKPFLLMGLCEYENRREAWAKIHAVNRIGRNDDQVVLSEMPSPSDFFEIFSRFYLNARKYNHSIPA